MEQFELLSLVAGCFESPAGLDDLGPNTVLRLNMLAVRPDIFDLIEEGNLGEVYFVRTDWRRAMGILPNPTMGRETGDYSRNWFNEKAMGGGSALCAQPSSAARHES